MATRKDHYLIEMVGQRVRRRWRKRVPTWNGVIPDRVGTVVEVTVGVYGTRILIEFDDGWREWSNVHDCQLFNRKTLEPSGSCPVIKGTA